MTGGVSYPGGDKTSKVLERVAETTQLDERGVGVTIGQGIEPPYKPERLAAVQEINGTHAVAVEKKAAREVGFGFDIVPHPRAGDDPSDEGRETVDEFWFGRDSIWKIGPTGTPAATPVEVFEQARQDFHGVGWLAIEVIYTSTDRPVGAAHLPAKSVRVRKSGEKDRKAGHGYVQERNGQVRYFAEAGDRKRTDVDGNDDPVYVDKNTGTVSGDRDAIGEPANELLFIPNPHPNALYYGIPSWVSELETMVGDREARRFNREFFEFDSLGQYFVVVEGGRLTDDSRQDVRNLVTGLREEKGRRVALLEAEELAEQGIDLEGDGSSGEPKIRIEQLQQHGDEDQAFTEYRARNEHDIAKVHQIPPQLVGVMENSNRANIEAAVRDFTKDVIEPQQERFAGRLFTVFHQKILGVDDWTLDFVTKGAENEREEAEIAEIIVGALGPALTVYEARELFGCEPQPDWMADELASTLLGELATGPSGPGDALDEALADASDEARQSARAAARVERGAAEGD